MLLPHRLSRHMLKVVALMADSLLYVADVDEGWVLVHKDGELSRASLEVH